MRVIITALALLMIGWPAQTTNADPYRWCAEYSDEMSGGASCYFHTLEQCRAAISGNGGFCRPNFQYTGSDSAPARKKTRRQH